MITNHNIELIKNNFTNLIYEICVLEENKTTLEDVQYFIETKTINNMNIETANLVNDLYGGWRYLLNNTEQKINVDFMCIINSIASNYQNPFPGRLRNDEVIIESGKNIPSIIAIEKVGEKLAALDMISDPITHAMELFIYITSEYLFYNGNTRTALFAASHILMQHNLGIFWINKACMDSYIDVSLKFLNDELTKEDYKMYLHENLVLLFDDQLKDKNDFYTKNGYNIEEDAIIIEEYNPKDIRIDAQENIEIKIDNPIDETIFHDEVDFIVSPEITKPTNNVDEDIIEPITEDSFEEIVKQEINETELDMVKEMIDEFKTINVESQVQTSSDNDDDFIVSPEITKPTNNVDEEIIKPITEDSFEEIVKQEINETELDMVKEMIDEFKTINVESQVQTTSDNDDIVKDNQNNQSANKSNDLETQKTINIVPDYRQPMTNIEPIQNSNSTEDNQDDSNLESENVTTVENYNNIDELIEAALNIKDEEIIIETDENLDELVDEILNESNEPSFDIHQDNNYSLHFETKPVINEEKSFDNTMDFDIDVDLHILDDVADIEILSPDDFWKTK